MMTGRSRRGKWDGNGASSRWGAGKENGENENDDIDDDVDEVDDDGDCCDDCEDEVDDEQCGDGDGGDWWLRQLWSGDWLMIGAKH